MTTCLQELLEAFVLSTDEVPIFGGHSPRILPRDIKIQVLAEIGGGSLALRPQPRKAVSFFQIIKGIAEEPRISAFIQATRQILLNSEILPFFKD